MNDTPVKIEGLSVYYGQIPAVTDVSLEVKKGDYLGIIGPNGSGKTTLLKTMLGLIPKYSGSVKIFGENPGRAKHFVGYVPQTSAIDKGFPISVLEVVLTGFLRPGISPFFKFSDENKKTAALLLDKVGLNEHYNRQVSELSGGEFQKLLIARALAVNPKLLLLDEPTANIDISSNKQIYDLLAELNKEMTIIIVTHDIMAVSSRVKSIACLNNRLIYHGEPELSETTLDKLYGCPVDLIGHGVAHRILREHEDGEAK